MIDWFELAIDPTIRRLGAVIRDQFDVHVGFVDLHGNQIPVGGTSGTPKIVCERFMANSVEGSDDAMTCRGSLMRWATDDVADGRHDAFKVCHAGLGAVTLPLNHQEEVVGSVYASGFLAAERADALASKVRSNIEREELLRDSELDDAISTIPLLDRAERGCLQSLMRAIVEEARERLALAPDRYEPVGDRYGDMIGTSPPMKSLFRSLGKIARGDSTVLIQGENGTGKELVARAIHQHSRRRDAPFIVQNCAAIPAELIESELFGHKKGAFSGAHRSRVGLFEAANHGTFFLDEIGEMDISLQVKLLRVLQEGTFLPVGDNVFRKVDVRIICATNRDLKQLVDVGEFREDLFYRINVIAVEAPPLRHRREDIPLLATYFLNKSCLRHDRRRKRLSDETVDDLIAHAWPGNVRELENEMERVVIMSGDDPVVEPEHLSLRAPSEPRRPLEVGQSTTELPAAIERLERHMILEGLRRTGWNKTQTAKELGVSRRNLIRKVANYELEKFRD